MGAQTVRLAELIRMALEEDAPFGDITSLSSVPRVRVRAYVLAKSPGVMACKPLLEGFSSVLPVLLKPNLPEGEEFKEGERLIEVEGYSHDVLLMERTFLNLLARMLGVATLTRKFVARSRGVPVYDTRKTLPLWRYLDRYAVRVGGGFNHRFSLSEVAMIKDNHKRIAGSLRKAVQNFRDAHPHTPLVVEVESLSELTSLKGLSVDWVLLDNMDLETLRRAVPLARSMGFKVEISGGITLENVSRYAALGPDRISVGSLTKAAEPVDLSLEVAQRLDDTPASPL